MIHRGSGAFTSTHDRIVIVGASLAGLRAAETLRQEGFMGQLTIIGDEPYHPYDRPPLSKSVLSGRLPIEHTALAQFQDIDAQWLLGRTATQLDVKNQRISLVDGQQVEFDRLLITTGARARAWSHQGQERLDGVFSLRERDDAQRIRARLMRLPRHVLIIGGGYIGSEIASVCRELDIAVTVTERGPTPLYKSLGAVMGKSAMGLYLQHRVDLRVNTVVTSLEADEKNQIHVAHLSDGTKLDVEMVIVALGAVRNIEWLLDSGLRVDPSGIVCDMYCHVRAQNGEVLTNIFTAGDVARWPHPRLNGSLVAIEHWGNAVTQGQTAAHNLLVHPSLQHPYTYLPAFWSTQFGVNIKSVGFPESADEVVLMQGSPEQYHFIAAYGRRGRMVAAVSFNMGRWLPFYQRLIESDTAFPPQIHGTDQPAEMQVIPAGLPLHLPTPFSNTY